MATEQRAKAESPFPITLNPRPTMTSPLISLFAKLPRKISLALVLTGSIAMLGLTTGCETPGVAMSGGQIAAQNAAAKASPEVLRIREGDVLKVAFPGAPNLDTNQTVRRDGRINLSLVGEVTAVGLTPTELEKQLSDLYASQLTSKEVIVTVVSSSFSVFVNGAVLRPGKITSDHPISALEAVMEAGGFNDTKANMKEVVVIRNENGQTKNYKLDLAAVIRGEQNEPFYLKPSDIVYVPEKFAWF